LLPDQRTLIKKQRVVFYFLGVAAGAAFTVLAALPFWCFLCFPEGTSFKVLFRIGMVLAFTITLVPKIKAHNITTFLMISKNLNYANTIIYRSNVLRLDEGKMKITPFKKSLTFI